MPERNSGMSRVGHSETEIHPSSEALEAVLLPSWSQYDDPLLTVEKVAAVRKEDPVAQEELRSGSFELQRRNMEHLEGRFQEFISLLEQSTDNPQAATVSVIVTEPLLSHNARTMTWGKRAVTVPLGGLSHFLQSINEYWQ